MIWVVGIFLCFVAPYIGIPVIIYAIFQAITGDNKTNNTSYPNNQSQDAASHLLKIRIRDICLGEDSDGTPAKEIQGIGSIPLSRITNVAFVTSVIDITVEDDPLPILSMIDSFQEKKSTIYQSIIDYGQIPTDQFFPDWARLGIVIPEILQSPRSGNRKLVIVVRMIDLDNPPSINYGFCDSNQAGLLWQSDITFTHYFKDKGYQEATEHHDECVGLAAKIGIAVAMVNGKMGQLEANVLKEWVVKNIDRYSDEKKLTLKELYNTALKEAYSAAKTGDLVLSSLTSRLSEIGAQSDKYDAIELCFDIMAADGVADAKELKLIRSIASALDLDFDEINKIHDSKIVALKPAHVEHANIETLLGIDSMWDLDRVKKHLREEFQKWNNRLNTLPEGTERENAQRMLDHIAEARKKYA